MSQTLMEKCQDMNIKGQTNHGNVFFVSLYRRYCYKSDSGQLVNAFPSYFLSNCHISEFYWQQLC